MTDAAVLDRPLRVLVVDDEPHARNRLLKLLRQHDGFETVGECGNGQEALEAIRADRPDLVLLDIQMPEMGGLDLIEAIEDEADDDAPTPAVIFVTAYDQHALRAFDLHAVDYLLKPFDDERFEQALARARARLQEGLDQRLLNLLRRIEATREEVGGDLVEAEPASEATPTDRIAIRAGDRIHVVKVEEIDWIEGAGVYARLHVGDKAHLLRETLTNLAQGLDPARFVRIHRSTIVNRERVRELRSYFHGEYIVVLEDGTQLKLSRTYRDALERLVGKLG
ncbi:MAG: LytTR family DNA-binding domain-containing protein [Rhodothermales bacterium]|nr:LytTR family DNA-binding domain-containing protein [Rhodothermales bacterium]